MNEQNIMTVKLPNFEVVENNKNVIKMQEIADKVMYEYTIQKNIKFYSEWLKHFSDDELRNLNRVLEAVMGERGLW